MSLGIATLLNYVPINLAATHQLGSLVVLTCGLYTAHSLRYASRSVMSKVAIGNVSKVMSGGGGGSGGTIAKGPAVVSKVPTMKL